MRLLGIDYGTKRIGLAWGDELGLATPLPALLEAEPAARFARLVAFARQRRATAFVVGYPYNMDGSVGPGARRVDEFIAELERATGLPVHRVDERLTSHAAAGTLSRRQRREDPRALRASGVIDSRAAALILQDYLDQLVPPALVEPPPPDDDPR